MYWRLSDFSKFYYLRIELRGVFEGTREFLFEKIRAYVQLERKSCHWAKIACIQLCQASVWNPFSFRMNAVFSKNISISNHDNKTWFNSEDYIVYFSFDIWLGLSIQKHNWLVFCTQQLTFWISRLHILILEQKFGV